jgi:DNA-binding CsgD family transcriptional regulator
LAKNRKTQTERVVAEYERAGRNAAETARRLGLSAPTVRYHLDKAGVKTSDTRRTVSTEKVLETYVKTGGNIAETARRLGHAVSTVRQHLDKAGVKKPVAAGTIEGEVRTKHAELPASGVKRYILTCAQNNTRVHSKAWRNILALAEHYEAEILVSRITYNISAYTAQPEKPGTKRLEDNLWYDPAVEPHVCDDRVEIAPGLVFCGELNILPTAARPLSGLETYTGRKSMVVPHVKLAMESVPSGKYEATKLIYTTGTVTQMSYIQRKAGQKAEFHHCYGGLLVEVDSEGRWFVRQLNADRQGTIHDLELRAKDGLVERGYWTEAVTWGDIHEDQIDPVVRELAWGAGGMLDTLRPRYQFMHDVLNFARRSHHNRNDPHRMFELYCQGRESVEDEVRSLVRFLNETSRRDWCRTVVVNSNHDNHLERWLKEADYRKDPVNALYFLRLQLRKYESIAAGDKAFNVLCYACQDAGCDPSIQWLNEDESFLICREIECGMHGHLGPNGAIGTPENLAKMGRKGNTAHTHRAGIRDGLYTAGTSSEMDLGYNVGPGAWSHSHIVTYENGKRAIVTMWRGAWRAE